MNSARSLRSRRLCGELFFGQIHRGDAEPAEIAQRKTIFPTDSFRRKFVSLALVDTRTNTNFRLKGRTTNLSELDRSPQ